MNDHNIQSVLEIGVYRGRFSQRILNNVPSINSYYMIDPWKVLEDWNKPLNTPEIENDYNIAMGKIKDHKDKVTVLRGTTLDMIDDIEDESLDFVYIDGDHTLRGITIDLIKSFNKVKPNGFIAGDDFVSKNQHGKKYEPTLVFPYAVFFAESMNVQISQLPHSQFLIDKNKPFNYNVTDKNYTNLSVNSVVN